MPLGKGSFGEVWLARFFGSSPEPTSMYFPTYVAVKLEQDVPQAGGIMQEFLTLKAIGKHPHIIEYIEYGKRAERVRSINGGQFDYVSYLALELAMNKTLLDYLLSRSRPIGEKWTRYWFLQILSGLKHMKK